MLDYCSKLTVMRLKGSMGSRNGSESKEARSFQAYGPIGYGRAFKVVGGIMNTIIITITELRCST